MEPLPQTKRFTLVLERIRSMVESGDVRAGERLPSERELALALGVNRSVVREALRALSSMGLVDIRHGTGVFVRETVSGHERLLLDMATGTFTPDLVPDLIEARQIVEGSLARKAAGNATAQDIARLETLLDDLARGVQETPPSLAADTPFHLAIAAMSGNRVLSSLLAVTYSVAGTFFTGHVATPVEATEVLDAHRRLVDAFRAHDGDRAEMLMKEHVASAARAFEKYSTQSDDTTGTAARASDQKGQ